MVKNKDRILWKTKQHCSIYSFFKVYWSNRKWSLQLILFPVVPPHLDERTFQGSSEDGAGCVSLDTFAPSSPASVSTSTSRSVSSSVAALESKPSSVCHRLTLCGSDGSTIRFLFSLCSKRRSSGTVFFLGRKREVGGRF